MNIDQYRYDVLGYFETRLNDDIFQLQNIEEYSNYFNNKSSRGGGLALYQHDKYQARVISNLTFKLSQIELFLEINRPQVYCWDDIRTTELQP